MNKITSFFVTALFLCAATLYSQDEYLDTSFGTNGFVLQNYEDTVSGGIFESEFGNLIVLADGKILTASNFHKHGPTVKYILNQYNVDGTLHSAFGTDGFVESDPQHNISAIHLQSNGKIVGLGSYASSSYLLRYNADGSLDNSFGTSGRIVEDIHIIKSFAIQSDDKIVMVKIPDYSGDMSTFKILRYNADGSPGVDFGTNGTVDFAIAASRITLQKILIQNNGKIIVWGAIRSDTAGDYSSNILFVRFNADGTLDTTFGEDGRKVFNYDYDDSVYDVMIQTDGKIVFSSSSYGTDPGVEGVKRIMRLNENGSLDAAFGVNGVKIITYPILNIQSLKQLPNGKILVAGIYETSVNPNPGNNPTPTAIVVTCYTANGDLDADFGHNGHILTTRNSSRALNDKLYVQADGKILVGASFCESWFSCHPHGVVVRYDPEQTLSIPEFNATSHFALYPNPVKETVTLDFTLPQPEVLSMKLYDNSARLISNVLKDQNFPKGMNSQKLDLPGTLVEGIYFLVISNGKNTTTIKLIK